MKNYLLFSLLATAIAISCHKKECSPSEFSDCLNDKFEQFKQQPDAISILATTNFPETMYLLHTTAPTYDGPEYFLGENCDTVCINCGFCIPPPCMDGFSFDKTKVIWEK